MDNEILIAAALHWWYGKQPCAWSIKQHHESPTVCTSTEREKVLAQQCAEYEMNEFNVLGYTTERERERYRRQINQLLKKELGLAALVRR